LGGGGNDAVKSTNINEIQILSAGYQKPAKTVKICAIFLMKFLQNIASYCTFYRGPFFLMKYFHPLHHIEQISDEMFASDLQMTIL
jgi:hypothetical protein